MGSEGVVCTGFPSSGSISTTSFSCCAADSFKSSNRPTQHANSVYILSRRAAYSNGLRTRNANYDPFQHTAMHTQMVVGVEQRQVIGCTCPIEQCHPRDQLWVGGSSGKGVVSSQAIAHQDATILNHILHECCQLPLPHRVVIIGDQRLVR